MRDLFGFKSLTLLNKIFSGAFQYFSGALMIKREL